MRKAIVAMAVALALIPATAWADELDIEEFPGAMPWEVEQADETAEADAIGGDEFMQLGVVEYGGRVETWYSSQVLYHYMTPEWTLDDEGFYRDSEGRYVVAASDVPYGSVIETSRGQAVVLDCGCPDGYTDFYVNWI